MRFFLLAAIVMLPEAVLAQPEPYKLGATSERQDNVPEGEVTKHAWTSKVFKDTVRDYYVYVPQQYDKTQPTAVMVFQDGHAYVNETGQFRVPIVFDNLIHAKKMLHRDINVMPCLTYGGTRRVAQGSKHLPHQHR